MSVKAWFLYSIYTFSFNWFVMIKVAEVNLLAQLLAAYAVNIILNQNIK